MAATIFFYPFAVHRGSAAAHKVALRDFERHHGRAARGDNVFFTRTPAGDSAWAFRVEGLTPTGKPPAGDSGVSRKDGPSSPWAPPAVPDPYAFATDGSGKPLDADFAAGATIPVHAWPVPAPVTIPDGTAIPGGFDVDTERVPRGGSLLSDAAQLAQAGLTGVVREGGAELLQNIDVTPEVEKLLKALHVVTDLAPGGVTISRTAKGLRWTWETPADQGPREGESEVQLTFENWGDFRDYETLIVDELETRHQGREVRFVHTAPFGPRTEVTGTLLKVTHASDSLIEGLGTQVTVQRVEDDPNSITRYIFNDPASAPIDVTMRTDDKEPLINDGKPDWAKLENPDSGEQP